MADDNNVATQSQSKKRKSVDSGTFGAIYGMALIGSLIYYIQHAASFWIVLLGIVKAIFWPAVIMYKVLELLQM
jgi:hypothetical protein